MRSFPTTSSHWFRCRPIFIALIGIFALCGCKSYRYAGAPPPSYDVDADLKQLSDQFKPATAVSNYYALGDAATTADRNKVISARLVMMNLQYLKWARTVTADKQLLDTASDVLILSLNLAGTATGGASAKTILAAISAGVAGSKTSVDKNYYYEKTLPALFAAMNAQRKTVLTNIIAGMAKPLSVYTFEQGLTELQEYYQAGTFLGAVNAVQADSGAKEKVADKGIQAAQIELSKVRSIEFAAASAQKRVTELIKKINQLKDAAALNLQQNPPVPISPEMDKIISLRDPNKKRLTDGGIARQMLKMQVTLGDSRSDKDLSAWEAAVISVQ